MASKDGLMQLTAMDLFRSVDDVLFSRSSSFAQVLFAISFGVTKIVPQ